MLREGGLSNTNRVPGVHIAPRSGSPSKNDGCPISYNAPPPAALEAVAAAADMALREKLALEVKARPQVPPAALFKPDVKRAPPKKKKKRLGHRHEHRRRLTSTAVREQLSIPSDAFVLTTIGTICRRKRQKWALYALRYLVQKKIDAYYVLVGAPSDKGGKGDPEYVVEFLNAVRKFDLQSRVRLVPFGVSVAPYLSAADLHTSPSSLEAYPLNTLEAMSVGVPVVRYGVETFTK